MAPKRPKIPGNCTQNIVIGYNHEDLSTKMAEQNLQQENNCTTNCIFFLRHNSI